MKRSTKRVLWGVVVIVGLPVLVVLVLWGWVLASEEVLGNPVALLINWPVACSTRGCITTKTWHDHYQARQVFAKAAEKETPKTREALTTLLRQHLVENAFLRAPITARDAARYREEILGATDEAQVREITSYTLQEYDERVILPLLKQEALKQQNSVESNDELYRLLAQERWLVVLPWKLHWDNQGAMVVGR